MPNVRLSKTNFGHIRLFQQHFDPFHGDGVAANNNNNNNTCEQVVRVEMIVDMDELCCKKKVL